MAEQAHIDVLATLQRIVDNQGRDIEEDHISADDALCAFVRALGYADVIELYHAIEIKWYA